MPIEFNPSGKPQEYLSGKTVNVIEDCEWAIFDGKSVAKAEVPSITLVEYQPVGDQFINRAIQFGKQLENGGDSYKDTYKADPTGVKYIFPYFTTEMRSKSNSWAQDTRITELASSLGGSIGQSIAGVGQQQQSSNVARGLGGLGRLGMNPVVQNILARAAGGVADVKYGASLGIEYPKIWQGSDAGATYTFDFYLFNTVSVEKIADNWKLIYLLSYNNSYNRRNLVLQDAPVLYEVAVPGVRLSPVSSMKGLNIDMVGQIRKLSGLPGGLPAECNIPEAYHITITMEDLYVESRQIFKNVSRPVSKVKVFTS